MSRLLEIEALAREELHAGHASTRPLGKDCHLVGLIGEGEFAKTFRQPIDLERRPGGDNGVDFTIPLRFTVDVKTARKAFYLIEEIGNVTADIYVLASYSDDEKKATLVGWEFGRELSKAPTRDFGHGVISHFISREKLRPMSELEKRVMHLT